MSETGYLNAAEIFGENVFNDAVMQERLPKKVYKKLKEVINEGKELDLETADVVAHEMKEWAIEKGATHFTHWFQPMTGVTAEKHDSFISPTNDGRVIMEFSGKELVKGEPDASSFPSGGLRATFEARGYTAWDPTSYAFIKDNTLCIPTAFSAYTGEALDEKTPLLRSMEAINKQALRILKLFGHTDVTRVLTSIGCEQEYFLIDQDLYEKRKDLRFTGRTLFGAKPPKGQELDDQYFANLKPRVAAYMADLDEALWKVGVFATTKHNEVAPAQHEMAPVFSTTNISTDQNELAMEVMEKVALKHGLVCLLHEKPFDGVNGSGKHNNWSMATNDGQNLLDPGSTPMENMQFLTFLCAIIKGIDEYADLLRISASSAGNDHRLGANEAPPAIISIFMGEELQGVLDALEAGTSYKSESKVFEIGVDALPDFPKDSTDRNRTSPFAFTGNRFEFRAPGSSVNCGSAMLAVNSAVAYQLQQFKKDVEALQAAGKSKEVAIFETLKAYIKESKPIRFDGNGYCDEWKAEAARRGLDCENSVPLQYDAYLKPEVIRMFRETGVLSEKELEARNEVKWEIYIKKVQIEARVLGDLSMNHIIPVVLHYQSLLLSNITKLKETFSPEEYEELSAEPRRLVRKISKHVNAVTRMTDEMIEARKKANVITDYRSKAIAYHDTVVPFLDDIREHIDELELMVDNQMWPLPKYRELLFIR